jgi:hypothetical protein
MRSKTSQVAVLVACASVAVAGYAAAGVATSHPAEAAVISQRNLSVPRYVQEKSLWCYATTIQMSQQYLRGSRSTQCAIVNGAMGTKTCSNTGATQTQVSTGYTKAGLSSTRSSGLPKEAAIKSEIDASRPIGYAYLWDNNSGHVVNITGYYYNYSGASTDRWAYWNDPANGVNYSGKLSYLSKNSSWKAYASWTGVKK